MSFIVRIGWVKNPRPEDWGGMVQADAADNLFRSPVAAKLVADIGSQREFSFSCF